MSAKAVLILCAQALMVQTVFSQYLAGGYADRITAPCNFGGVGVANDIFAYNDLAGTGFGLVGNALAYEGAYGIANAPGIAPASGGALPISSASPIAPTGISVASENAIEGILAVTGDMPFVSAVALEGALPTAGAGTVAYSCGNGNIGIVSEGVAAGVTLANELAYGSGLAASRGFGGFAAPAFGAARGFGEKTAFSQYLGRGCAERIVTPCGLAGAGLANAYNGVAGASLGLAGNALAYGGAYDGAYDGAYGIAGIANAPGIAPTSGGAMPISSASPIAPTGISLASENGIEGILAVTGDLPFVSAVAWEGALPTAGAGTVTYSGGNGNIGIVSDNGYGIDVAGGLAYGNGMAYGNCFASGAAVADRIAYGPSVAASRGFGGIAVPAFGGCGFGSAY